MLILDTSVLGLHCVVGIELPCGPWSSVYRFRTLVGYNKALNADCAPSREGLFTVWGEQALSTRTKITAQSCPGRYNWLHLFLL